MSSVGCPLRRVFTPARSFDRYRPYASSAQYDAVCDRARQLRHLRVVEVNSTPHGGGVATMLHSIIPVLAGLGLDAAWYSMCDEPGFFDLTKHLANLLQGADGRWTTDERDGYLGESQKLAAELDRLSADVLVIHDPQPAAAYELMSRRPSGGAIWRGHIDLHQPNLGALAFFEPLLQPYELVVLEVPADRLPTIPLRRQRFVPDAIDPLVPKNQLISREAARRAMARVGIDINDPVISQVARFDYWKDPIGVVEAYRQARLRIPGLQLALLGTFVAQDDPTAVAEYEKVKRFVGDDPQVHLYTDPKVINQIVVNAFQTGSDAILQLSRREGFGIAATEAMWKFNAVIAGDVPGLRAQITDGVNGYLVTTCEAAADRIERMVQDRLLARRIGEAAHQTVGNHFLLPRLIDDWLGLFQEVVGQRAARAA
jgi:trehalose synthase